MPYLAALLKDQDGELVKSALQALGAIGAPEGESHLLDMLGDPRPAVRREAARALGQLEL